MSQCKKHQKEQGTAPSWSMSCSSIITILRFHYSLPKNYVRHKVIKKINWKKNKEKINICHCVASTRESLFYLPLERKKLRFLRTEVEITTEFINFQETQRIKIENSHLNLALWTIIKNKQKHQYKLTVKKNIWNKPEVFFSPHAHDLWNWLP